jgi:hypothetical protein
LENNVSNEKQHAEAGPSSSKTWMRCPASVTKSRGKLRHSSPYAREGTAAHAVAEALILGEEVPPVIDVEGDSIVVSEDMLDYVAPYVAFADMMETSSDFFAVEQRVTLEAYFPDGMPEPVFGTADLIAYSKKTRRLTVADFKYGKGVKVKAAGNTQGRTYALGAIAALVAAGFSEPVEIEILIFQPRVASDPDREVISHAELMTWFIQELKPAIERIGAGDETENPGECQFCPRIGECRAAQSTAMEASRLAFDDGKVFAPQVASLTNAEIGEILDKADMIENWIKGLRAEASLRIDAGQTVPGWKLAPKRAMRKWKDEGTVVEACARHGLTPNEIYERKVKSPAAMEKELKAGGMTKEGIAVFLKDLVVKESSGTTLVPESDSRPGVSIASVFDAAPLALPSPSAEDVF